MWSLIRKFSFIMLINLFAFLAVWHILDAILGGGAVYKIVFLILSIPSLIYFSKGFFKKALKDMEDISPENNKNNKQNKNESK